MEEHQRQLRVGIAGAGIGGVMAAIAMADAGCRVTVLEAAAQLGEIGAGIQMVTAPQSTSDSLADGFQTPNVARLLIRYGIDEVIGEDLVRFDELNLRRKDGSKVGHTFIKRVEDATGFPWWLAHRHHLHTGLVTVAQKKGVDLVIDSRVVELQQRPENKVSVTTEQGQSYTFDLLVGSDGIQSVVRKTLFPDVRPTPPNGNCAYRAIVPYDEVRKDPIARKLVEDSNGNLIRTMEVW